MRIALVSEHESPLTGPVDNGGHRIAELATALAGLGASVDVYTRRDNDSVDDEVVTTAGYRVLTLTAGPARRLPASEFLLFTSAFGSGLRDRWALERPDIVHAHCWMSGLAGGLAAHEVGVPTVMSFHGSLSGDTGNVSGTGNGSGSEGGPSARVILERKILRSAGRIVASCSDEADRLTHRAIARAKIAIVPSGVDTVHFNPDGPAVERVEPGQRLITGGDLSSGSGVDAIVDIVRRVPKAELFVIGGGPDIQRLHRLAVDLGVADRVVFGGAVPGDHLPAVLRSGAIFICTSPSESAAVAALEAMACGVPVVARALGSVTDVVVDGVTGRLVDPRNRKALAKAVENLVHDQPRRFALGVAGADRAQSRYSWDRIAENTFRVYDDALSTSKARRALVE